MSEVLGSSSYYFPNKISRILLMAMRDVLGGNNINAVLNMARLQYFCEEFPPPNFEPGLTFEEIARLSESLEGIYGLRGGRRLLRRTGQACFQYGIEGLGGIMGVADFALRLLPISMRVYVGLEVLAEILNRYSDQHISLNEDDKNYYFIMNQCGLCWGRHTDSAVCMIMGGLLEETLYWVSRGQHFFIEETTCIACGDDACTLRIDKTPLK